MCPSLHGWQCRVVVSADRGDLQTRRHERRVSLLGQRHSILGHPSGFLFAAFVSSQPHVTRFPAAECGACFGLPDSPRLWPLAPSAPQGVTALSGADLRGADLSGANLESTNLINCRSLAVSVWSVDLTRTVNLIQKQIDRFFGVKSGMGKTILPEHLSYPDHWYSAESVPEADSETVLDEYENARSDWLSTVVYPLKNSKPSAPRLRFPPG